MGAVVSIVSDVVGGVVDAVGDAVETVGDAVSDVADFAGDTIQNALENPIQTISTVAAYALAPTTGGASLALIPVGTAAQVLDNGGSFEDAVKGAAISYAAQNIATNIAGDLSASSSLGTDAFSQQTSQLAAQNAGLVAPDIVSSSIGNAAGAFTGSTLSGADLETALQSAAGAGGGTYVGGNVAAETRDILGPTGSSIAGKTAGAATSAAITGRDPGASAINAFVNNVIRTSLSDVGKPSTTAPAKVSYNNLDDTNKAFVDTAVALGYSEEEALNAVNNNPIQVATAADGTQYAMAGNTGLRIDITTGADTPVGTEGALDVEGGSQASTNDPNSTITRFGDRQTVQYADGSVSFVYDNGTVENYDVNGNLVSTVYADPSTPEFTDVVGSSFGRTEGTRSTSGAGTSGISGGTSGEASVISTPAQTSVRDAYRAVLGREPDAEGLQYWASQVEAGNVSLDDLAATIAYGAQGSEDQRAANTYLGSEIFAGVGSGSDSGSSSSGGGSQTGLSDEEMQNASDFLSNNPTPEEIFAAAEAGGYNSDQVAEMLANAGGTSVADARAAVDSYLSSTGQTLSGDSGGGRTGDTGGGTGSRGDTGGGSSGDDGGGGGGTGDSAGTGDGDGGGGGDDGYSDTFDYGGSDTPTQPPQPPVQPPPIVPTPPVRPRVPVTKFGQVAPAFSWMPEDVSFMDTIFTPVATPEDIEGYNPLKNVKPIKVEKIGGLGLAGKFINQQPDDYYINKEKDEETLGSPAGWQAFEPGVAPTQTASGDDTLYFNYNFNKPWWNLTEYPMVNAAAGGQIGHNPEFYSEGGASIGNRYVKGRGDGTSDSVPAMLATGEFVIPADVVSSLGNGDNDAGASVLDNFMSEIRKHKRDVSPDKLPPDSMGPLSYLDLAMRKSKGKRK